MAQDLHQQAKERFDDAQEAVREQHMRMREDLRFSNPADPQQWDGEARLLRAGRPCLTFDRTNQFISQVVNDSRQNKPAVNCLPADSRADIAVAEKLNGIIRHIEYVSRAGIAYDTAIEYAARIGLGWLRVVPEIMRPETNEQEIRIKRVHDPLSIVLDPNSTEPDGADAMYGFAETNLTKREFERLYPKAKQQAWESNGWFTDKEVRIAEYFKVNLTKQNFIPAIIEGQRQNATEDDYWAAHKLGNAIQAGPAFEAKTRSVKWCKLSGSEVLEETDFPSQYLPLIPVLGYELWVDGKRYLCGMTRRLMDGQRAYNYERSAFIESVALQPKAPFLAAWESVENFEDQWNKLGQTNPSWLPFNAVGEGGETLPMPSRQMPPTFPVAFAQGGQIATADMEASVGMHRANLGQEGNETSGKAIKARQQEGDTANYHYIDNLSRSIEQLGRVVVDMIPRIYDTPRQARIVGEDGEQDFVAVDPSMDQAVRKEGKKVVAINPNVGAYDVRVKAGPNYTTLRQESAEQLSNMLQAAPDLMPILGDVWVRMQDWPEADKVAQRLKTMLPPQIQALEAEDGADIPPEAAAMIESLKGQIQGAQQMMQQAGEELQTARSEAEQAKIAAARAGLQTQQVKMQADANAAKAEIERMIAEGQPQPEAPDLSVELDRIKLDFDRKLLDEHKQTVLLQIQLAEERAQRSVEQAETNVQMAAHDHSTNVALDQHAKAAEKAAEKK
jgi:hypothetical protein